LRCARQLEVLVMFIIANNVAPCLGNIKQYWRLSYIVILQLNDVLIQHKNPFTRNIGVALHLIKQYHLMQ